MATPELAMEQQGCDQIGNAMETIRLRSRGLRRNGMGTQRHATARRGVTAHGKGTAWNEISRNGYAMTETWWKSVGQMRIVRSATERRGKKRMAERSSEMPGDGAALHGPGGGGIAEQRLSLLGIGGIKHGTDRLFNAVQRQRMASGASQCCAMPESSLALRFEELRSGAADRKVTALAGNG